MPNDLRPGARRIETVQVVHVNGVDKTYMAMYLHPDGGLSVLVDEFKGGAWTSTLLPPNVTDSLRKMLNRGQRQAKEEL